MVKKTGKLILQFNGITLKEIPLEKKTLTIGRRENNDIIIGNLAVSERHARVMCHNNKFIIVDLNSVSGTFVNEMKIDKCELYEGDRILIGKHTLVFLSEDEKDSKPHTLPPVKEEQRFDHAAEQVFLDKNVDHIVEEQGRKVDFKAVVSYLPCNGDIKKVPLHKRITTIGKGENADIKVEGRFIGESAAVISKMSDSYYISRGNGFSAPKLNGASLKGKGKVRLSDNDFIEVGTSKIHFSIKKV